MLGDTSLKDGDFVAVDIETTGPIPGHDSIIEIGAVRLRGGRIVGYFETLVRPASHIPRAIVELTGITDEMVAHAPEISDAVRDFRSFCEGAVLVAHNHRFDLGFLDFESERICGQPFQRPVLDTLLLSRRLHPEAARHNLREVARRYGVGAVPTHRALADALATAEIFCVMIEEQLARWIETAADAARFCGLAPHGDLARKLSLATALPDSPGVFIFRDAEGRVVYVGRARRIRSRVRSFFYGSFDHGVKNPGTAVARVEALGCTGLHAHILESRLKARYAPLYNQDNERGRRAVYIRVDTTQAFPPITVMGRRPKTGIGIGPFTNPWATRVVVQALREQFGLRMCARRVSSPAAATCPDRAASACPSPCAGAITRAEYGARLTAALSVFDGGHGRFRATLQALRERAAIDLRYEDAIVYRDTLKAFDKCLSTLEIVRHAVARRGSAIVERNGESVTALLLRRDRVVAIVRGSLAQGSRDRFAHRLRVAARRAFSPSRMAEDPFDISIRHLRELFIVDGYRKHVRPYELVLSEGPDELVDGVLASLGAEEAVTSAMPDPEDASAAPR